MILSSSQPIFSEGLMLLTLTIEPLTTAEQPTGEAGLTILGQPVWKQELTGDSASPFAQRLTFVSVRPPYQYSFALECAPPNAENAAEKDAFMAQCRHVWDFISFSYGLCALPKGELKETTAWQSVNDAWHQYAFEVPNSWLLSPNGSADRLKFFSDDVYGQPHNCPIPNGLMTLDFAADPPSNFGTGTPESTPDLGLFSPLTIAGRSSWIRRVLGKDEEGMNPLATGTAVYIQGPQFWYYFWLSCTPPTDANETIQAQFKNQCEGTMSHVLESFQISGQE